MTTRDFSDEAFSAIKHQYFLSMLSGKYSEDKPRNLSEIYGFRYDGSTEISDSFVERRQYYDNAVIALENIFKNVQAYDADTATSCQWNRNGTSDLNSVIASLRDAVNPYSLSGGLWGTSLTDLAGRLFESDDEILRLICNRFATLDENGNLVYDWDEIGRVLDKPGYIGLVLPQPAGNAEGEFGEFWDRRQAEELGFGFDDALSTVLDGLSYVPVVGLPFSIINSGLSAVDGTSLAQFSRSLSGAIGNMSLMGQVYQPFDCTIALAYAGDQVIAIPVPTRETQVTIDGLNNALAANGREGLLGESGLGSWPLTYETLIGNPEEAKKLTERLYAEEDPAGNRLYGQIFN